MIRFGASLVLALGLAWAAPLRAQQVETLWNCKDKDGRTTLTNQKADTVGKECRVVQQERVSVVPPNKGGKTPANFPRESVSDRLAAKTRQRETLENELSQEESMLADAKKKLAEQEAIRNGDEKNYQRVLDRLKPYQDTVEVHQKNVEALRRELSNLSR
ncbi:MAG TPA: hypothetical protein VLV90_12390 [Burkholderiales bacterium]|nr:hypothetical protein [Burkholderiales bacterium]